MNYEERIRSKEELAQWIADVKEMILYGRKGCAMIFLRYCHMMQYEEKIKGLSYIWTKKDYIAFDKYQVKKIEEYTFSDTEKQVVIFGRNREECAEFRNNVKLEDEGRICYVDYEFLASLSQAENVDLDFLCVGFTKCGTTSLWKALRCNKELYLPKEKEILYGKWVNTYLDAPERFRKLYFSGVSKERKLGCIEPTYFQRASFCYENFGSRPKIIFIMRNPADASYSYFKMKMRRSENPVHRRYYKKYKRYTPLMFKDYIKDDILTGAEQRYSYDVWIKEYLQYYDRSNMYFIFFEEIIREPERILWELQKFLGITPLADLTLPYTNSGNRVAKNYYCARINEKLHEKRQFYRENASHKKTEHFKRFCRFVWSHTQIENNEKIPQDDKEFLLDYYKDSISEVEKITGKNLKGLWY